MWLDGGVARGLPVTQDLRAWLRFVAARIVPAIPSDLRAAVSLSIEVPHDAMEEMAEALDEIVNEPDFGNDRLRCSVLHPLGPVSRGEIRDFLEVTGCPPNLRDELADLLMTVTQGEYAGMRRWIDRALASTWVDIAAPLREAAGKKLPSPRRV